MSGAAPDPARAYAASLERLLALLDAGRGADARELAAAWRACASAFECLPLRLAPDERASLQKLHAVATSYAARARDEAAAEIARVADARLRLAAHSPMPRTGLDCDVSG